MCGGAEYRGTTLAEEVYDPNGMICGDCRHRWNPRSWSTACPECGSENIGDFYPEIPSLDGEPGLALVLAVESQIPRTENGTLLHREMVRWLRFHGVRSRSEILTWEWFFLSIGAIRAGILEEMREPIRKGENEERED